MLGVLLFLVAHGDNGKSFEGVISGAVCGVHNMVCEHKPKAHGFETLGIFIDGKGFFYFSNVPQRILRKLNRKEVEVIGKLYEEYRTIQAELIKLKGKVVWQAKGEKHH